jgi:23S rRNA pseudouridine2604 synthase
MKEESPQSNEQTTSLNKFISDTGRCSRREADKMIEEGRVLLNGVVAKKGNRAGADDIVLIDGEPLTAQDKAPAKYIAFNKPIGITCTTDQNIPGNIIDYIQYPERIFPIGRLDKPSEGLIFLTNDGDIVNKILRAGNNHEKEYLVSVHKAITEEFIRKMSSGIPILGTYTKKCKVEKINNHSFKIVLTQGLNRQIRRMCDYLGYEVTSLTRTRIMNIKLEPLEAGQWRLLTEDEVAGLQFLVKDSRKTV